MSKNLDEKFINAIHSMLATAGDCIPLNKLQDSCNMSSEDFCRMMRYMTLEGVILQTENGVVIQALPSMISGEFA